MNKKLLHFLSMFLLCFITVGTLIAQTPVVFNPPLPPTPLTVECDAIPPPATLTAEGCNSIAPFVFINEIHYDNTGGDVGEFIEVVGTAGFDLSNCQLVLYNGSNSQTYGTMVLSGAIDDEGSGFGAVAFTYPVNGIQNGNPDGIALVCNGTVIEFLSYEGVITASGGPADGMTSTDIGVSEPGAIGESLQLIGMGCPNADFQWTGPVAESPGTINAGQTFTPASCPGSTAATVTLSETTTPGACAGNFTIVRTWTATDGCGTTAQYTQTINVVDTTPPVFCNMPASTNLDCAAAIPTPPVVTAVDACNVGGPSAWINEIHYDNVGGDVGEFFEVAGKAGFDLSNCQMVLYNGSNGSIYNTIPLSGIIPNETAGYGAIGFSLPANGLQNGSPDGLALVCGGTVLEFLSYEGSFTPTTGPAAGMTSTDIGVSEPSNNPLGLSLQLTGCGTQAWAGPTAESPGALNAGQTIGVLITATLVETSTPGVCNTITRTWTATDDCGNSATYTQTLTVVDNAAPVVTCPPSQTLTCFESVPNSINTAADFIAAGGTISDNCTANLADFTIFSQGSTNGGSNCPGDGQIVTRTYYVSDACGNISTCTQTFTYLESTQGPVITSVLPTCYKYCGNLVNPSDSDITYTTDCAFDGTVTITGPVIIGPENCPGTIYRFTYAVTDDCGRTSAPVTRDFVIGNDGPTIVCPETNLILECGDPNNDLYIQQHLALPTANTACELGYTITNNYFPIFGTPCVGTRVVTFTVTDACNRTATCTTTITILDTTAPVITSTYVPGECDEIECSGDINGWFNIWRNKVQQSLSATDNCQNPVWSTVPSNPQPNQDCNNGEAVTWVTWVARDNCGNESEVSYYFKIVDTNAPTFTFVPADATIACDDDPVFGTPTATDECGNVTITFEDTANNTLSGTLSGDQEVPPSGSNGTGSVTGTLDVLNGTLVMNVSFSGLSGNTTASHLHNAPAGSNGGVFLNLGPLGFPTGVTSGSYTATATLTAAQVATTLAGNAYMNIHTEAVPSGELRAQIKVNTCEGSYTRTWTAEDECDLTSTASQTLSYQDTDGPVISGGSDTTVECDGNGNTAELDAWLADNAGATATDDCNNATWSNNDYDPANWVDDANCTGGVSAYVDVTFSAIDDCGNESDATYRFNVTDTTPPNAPAPPADVNVQCASDVPAPVDLTASDACDGDITVSPSAVITPGNCDNQFTMVRTWTFVDNCGNQSSVSQTINVNDTTPPEICPVMVSGEFSALGGTFNVNFSGTNDNGIVSGNAEFIQQSGPFLAHVLLDANCIEVVNGNELIYGGVITDVLANNFPPPPPPPPGSPPPACNPFDLGNYVYFRVIDNGPGNTDQVYSFFSQACSADPTCRVGFNWNLPFISIQDVDNASNDIIIEECTLPDVNVQCAADVPPPVDMTATDNCYGDITVSPSAVITPGNCDNQFTMVRTWTFVDGCGNQSSVSQTINVDDTTPPSAPAAPADVNVQCASDVPPPVDLTANDNCDGDITVSPSAVITPGNCDNQFTMVRTWTFTDGCGNQSSVSQTITVDDTTDPTFTFVPADYESGCIDDNNNVTTYAQICASSDDAEEDDDTGEMDLTSSDLELTEDPSQDKDVKVGLRFKDLNIPAGATITAAWIQFTADATLGIDPVVLTVNGEDSDDALTFTEEDNNITDRPFTTATVGWEPGDWMVIGDNHEVERTPDLSSIVQEIVNRSGYTVESALAFIFCGEGKRTGIAYDLNPDQAPEIYVSYTVDPFGTPTAEDNCGTPIITHVDTEMGGCAGSKTRTWTATDECGNTATAAQTITFFDNVPPVFTFVPEHVEDDCDFLDFPPTFGMPIAEDNCGDPDVTFVDFFEEGDEESCDDEVDYDYRRMWTATDACGNTTTAVQRFNVNGTDYSSLTGFIFTEEEQAVEDVEVSLTGFGGFNAMSISQPNGTYGYNGLQAGSNYTVTPYLNANPLNGVSTYDLVLISKHILQTQLLDSPYKMIAADINNSGAITTLDLVELRKVILFVNDEFTNNTSWRFVEADFVFPQANNPFASIFPEATYINGLVLESEYDYVAVKVGDVNTSVIANSMAPAEDRTMKGELTFVMDDATLQAGEEYEVVVKAEDFNKVSGYQYTLNFDAAQLDLIGMAEGELPNLKENNFGWSKVNEGVITTSWNSNEGVTMAADTELFRLTFRAKTEVTLSEALSVGSRYTQAEAYNSELSLMDISLRFEGAATVSNNGYALYQNQPNPFKATTVIGFELPEATAATLSIYDVSGRMLKQVEGDFAKGYNEVSVEKSDLQASGVVYYKLVTAEFEKTMKMMIVE